MRAIRDGLAIGQYGQSGNRGDWRDGRMLARIGEPGETGETGEYWRELANTGDCWRILARENAESLHLLINPSSPSSPFSLVFARLARFRPSRQQSPISPVIVRIARDCPTGLFFTPPPRPAVPPSRAPSRGSVSIAPTPGGISGRRRRPGGRRRLSWRR